MVGRRVGCGGVNDTKPQVCTIVVLIGVAVRESGKWEVEAEGVGARADVDGQSYV